MTKEADRIRLLERRNHCLKMQTRNLQRQIKSLESWNKRLEGNFLEVARCNCSGPQREAETFKEIVFRALSRIADDGSVPGGGGYTDPQVMAKAAELKALIMATSKVKCRYD